MGIGLDVMTRAMEQTTLFAMLHGNFDAILFKETSAWFGGQAREQLFREAITRGLAAPAPQHGAKRRLHINNLFFGGKLPRFLGFDYEFEHIGSRATIPQSQIYQSAGRDNSFAATFRMICDFATSEIHTNMAGGASGERFSPYYKAGIKEWLEGVYQVIKL
jgi:penicillin amidase